jgi:hypothetical protein
MASISEIQRAQSSRLERTRTSRFDSAPVASSPLIRVSRILPLTGT